jgi:hypothetical protein
VKVREAADLMGANAMSARANSSLRYRKRTTPAPVLMVSSLTHIVLSETRSSMERLRLSGARIVSVVILSSSR